MPRATWTSSLVISWRSLIKLRLRVSRPIHRLTQSASSSTGMNSISRNEMRNLFSKLISICGAEAQPGETEQRRPLLAVQ